MIDGPPGGYHGQFSKEADARLIAAAPELYEEGLALLAALAGPDPFDSPNWHERVCTAKHRFAAVLNKARGEP